MNSTYVQATNIGFERRQGKGWDRIGLEHVDDSNEVNYLLT